MNNIEGKKTLTQFLDFKIDFYLKLIIYYSWLVYTPEEVTDNVMVVRLILNMVVRFILNMVVRFVLNMVFRFILNMVVRFILNMVVRFILNMVVRFILNMVVRFILNVVVRSILNMLVRFMLNVLVRFIPNMVVRFILRKTQFKTWKKKLIGIGWKTVIKNDGKNRWFKTNVGLKRAVENRC